MTYTPYRSRFLAPLGGMFTDAAARRWWVNWRGQMRLPEKVEMSAGVSTQKVDAPAGVSTQKVEAPAGASTDHVSTEEVKTPAGVLNQPEPEGGTAP